MSANTRQRFVRRMSREQRERVRTDVSIPFVNRLRREQRPQAKEQIAAVENEPVVVGPPEPVPPSAGVGPGPPIEGNEPGTAATGGTSEQVAEVAVETSPGGARSDIQDRGEPGITVADTDRFGFGPGKAGDSPEFPSINIPDVEAPQIDLSGLTKPLLILGAVLVGLLALSEFAEGAGKGVTS